MDRFNAMQAFARVVEAGSFTKAAQTLHMSKTTVTQLVQQLEARLRVKLLNRTTRQVKVTADGATYYERVVRLLADMEDADTSLSSAVASPRGRLRVDVPSPLARMILMPALPEFHARYPEIQLYIGVSDCTPRGSFALASVVLTGPSCEASIGCFGCSPGEVLRDWKSPNPQSTQITKPNEHP